MGSFIGTGLLKKPVDILFLFVEMLRQIKPFIRNFQGSYERYGFNRIQTAKSNP